MKKEAFVPASDEELASSKVFPIYDPNKEMMEFMVVMPPPRDNNLAES